MSLPATIVRTSLKLARLPVDVVLGVVGRRTGPGATAQAVVDRVDAKARAAAGEALGDTSLKTEAYRGAAAADRREQAADLAAEAEDRREAAQAREDHVEQTAQEQRAAAGRIAERREAEVAQDAEARREQAADHEERDRLRALEREEQALDEEADAVRAKDEAQRLEAAAGRAKAQRRSGD